jgi:hypothetical protein
LYYIIMNSSAIAGQLNPYLAEMFCSYIAFNQFLQ